MGRADTQEIGQLFKRHGATVYRRSLRLLGNAADAEEATQDIFIRAMKGEGGFEQRSQLTTWLYQITTNHCLNVLRDQKRRAALRREHLPEGDEAAAPARSEAIAVVRRLLADAEPLEAQAAVYVFIDGMSHEEAAPLLGVSKRTVGNLIERLRASAQAAGAEPGAQPLAAGSTS